jgi:hypothetical protein
MSVMEAKNITGICVKEKSHIFLDVARFTLSVNLKVKITNVAVTKILLLFINFFNIF